MTLEIYNTICQWLRELIAGTCWEGHIFAVGGCCRDVVMNRPINDIDLAVDVENGGMLFADWLEKRNLTVTPIIRFERYGTAMLHFSKFPQYEIEIVQTRRGKYTDENADNPGSVFGTIEEDACRRDFTVNSLFYDITNDRLLDLTGKGLADLEAHRLRTPMEPTLTFYDDPVRILRCIRMACAWGWVIDRETLAAMRASVRELKTVKPERRRAEFEKMLTGPDPVRALELARTSGAMRFIFPELENLYRNRNCGGGITLWQCALRTIEALGSCDDLNMRLAALLYVFSYTQEPKNTKVPQEVETSLNGAHKAEKILKRLKYHNPRVKEVTFLIRNHAATLRWGNQAEYAKDRTLQRLTRLCVTNKRLDGLLRFIHAIHTGLPQLSHKTQQVPKIRERLFASRLLDYRDSGPMAAEA